MTPELKESIANYRQKIYDALKAANPYEYRAAIASSESVILNHNLPQHVAVDVVAAVVCSVAYALGVKP